MKNDVMLLNVVTYEFLINLHMFSSGMKHWIVSKRYGRHVVAIEIRWIILRDAEISEKSTKPDDIGCEGGKSSILGLC
ncbi:hypothetical protein MA16_Dca005812 [Dendrobium catenatum]|uniref:Uncharacterized protein n=1 Tax=Dendrobium catenatum TaxID=906689 RepID=A0A2I0VIQ7_9ASPA|nr:hypothetical protein MA16_Dca014755 [Dendrobium catenatum]PKU80281.1 hypothetical protein MA16_Dca005812 [Dendrobium catenatum]